MPVPHCMFSAGRCVFWCLLAGGESDFCGRNGLWKGLIFRHNRVFVQNQGTVLKKSSLRGVHPGDFPSRQGKNERRPISCAHSSWIKRSTLLCRKMTRVHPVGSFPPPQKTQNHKITVRSEAERVINHNLPVCHRLTEVIGVQHCRPYGACSWARIRRLSCLKKNQNAPRPSEHPPVRGKKCQNV